MFGKNPLRKQEPAREDGQLWVTEIFPTIQGEGPHAGRPAVFIRLGGCNLRCWFCDTEFEKGSEWLPLERIVHTVNRHWATALRSQSQPRPLVVITGGEPFRQDICNLVGALTRSGYHVQVETAGTLWLDNMLGYLNRGEASLVVSPKTPVVNGWVEQLASAYKYIVRDGEWDAVEAVPKTNTQDPTGRAHVLARPPQRLVEAGQVYLQPCDDQCEGGNRKNAAAAVQYAQDHGYRVCLQIHKILELP